MNKAEFINAMTAESGLSRVDSKKALEVFFSSVAKALSAGDKISLAGSGTSSVAERAERSGTNPSTKKVIIIPVKRVAKFKSGVELADTIK